MSHFTSLLGQHSEAKTYGLSAFRAEYKSPYVVFACIQWIIIADVSDPANPTFAGSWYLDSTPLSIDSMFAEGNYVYVGIHSSSHVYLYILDITNPASIITCCTYTTSATSGFSTSGVAKYGNYVYLCLFPISAEPWHSIGIVNVTDPYNPVDETTFTDATHLSYPKGLLVVEHYLYVQSGANLVVYDVIAPTTPSYITSVDIGSGGQGYFMKNSGNYIYAVGFNTNSIDIIDITTRTAPVKLATITSATLLYGVRNLDVGGGYVYGFDFSSSPFTVSAWDISTPASPSLVGTFDVTAAGGFRFGAVAVNPYNTASVIAYGNNDVAGIACIGLSIDDSESILEQAYSVAGVRQSIFSNSPTWTDITPYLKQIKDFQRGRLHELNRIEAGTATFVLDNASGNFWRYNTNGAYYDTTDPDNPVDNIKPMTLTRLRYRWHGTYYPLFYGYSESYNPGWMQIGEAGHNPVVDIKCVDMFKAFTRYELRDANPKLTADAHDKDYFCYVDNVDNLHEGQSILIYQTSDIAEIKTMVQVSESLKRIMFDTALTHEYSTATKLKKFPLCLSGTRIKDCLLELGWPKHFDGVEWKLYMAEIDDGQYYVQAFTPSGGTVNIMEHMYNVAESEGGLIFMRPDGSFIFQDSLARTKSPYDTSQATFIDDGTPNLGSYIHPDLKDDDTFIYNEAATSGNFGGSQSTELSWAITDLQAEQGPRVYKRTDTQLSSAVDAQAQNLAFALRYSDSILRCDSLIIRPQADPDNLFPLVMGGDNFALDISGRITFVLDSTINPAMMYEQQYHIEGISHSWEATTNLWETKWQLWNVNLYRILSEINDGDLVNTDDTSYTECHDADDCNDPGHDDDSGEFRVGQWTQPDTPKWGITRGFWEFDTSTLTEDVTQAYIVYQVAVDNNGNPEVYVDNPWTLVLVDNDSVEYPLLGYPEYYGWLEPMGKYEDSYYGDIPITDTNGVIEINQEGIDHINEHNSSVKFALRSYNDIHSIDPGLEIYSVREYAIIKGVGSDAPPKLIVRVA